jgi:hypothetical protein
MVFLVGIAALLPDAGRAGEAPALAENLGPVTSARFSIPDRSSNAVDVGADGSHAAYAA